MKARARVASAIGLIGLIVGSLTGTAQVAAASDVVGHVYVNDNTAGTNTIGAFDQHGDGTLTPMNGSPFAAGGAGTGAALGSQGSLQITADGRFLLAADAGSNEISVLRVAEDGTLTPADGSPVSSGGIKPVSIAVNGKLVYVANLGDGTSGSNYTGFKLKSGGRLKALAGSTIPLPATANPGDILFNSTGTNLVGIEVGTTDPSTFLIDSFAVGSNGLPTPAAGSPFAAEAAGPFGSEFSPTEPGHLYVSNAHAGAENGSVSAFSVSEDGSLSPIGDSPYFNGQTAPCWVEITHNGKFLFAVNTASASISGYRIRADGSLKLRTTTPLQSGPGIAPFDARLDPSGEHLYVVDAAIAAVSIFDVAGASLTELSASPAALPAGATPFGIVVTAA